MIYVIFLSSQRHATTQQQKLPTIATERRYINKTKKMKPGISILGVGILFLFYLSIFSSLDMYNTSRLRMVFFFCAKKRSGVKIGSFGSDSCVNSEQSVQILVSSFEDALMRTDVCMVGVVQCEL
jgi:hypothetical protein